LIKHDEDFILYI